MDGDLPLLTNANEVVAQVMHDHGISHQRLADVTGIDRTAISRMVGADPQRVVAPEVLAAVYRLSGNDERIACLALGDHDHIHLPLPRQAPEWADAQASAINSAAAAIVALSQHQDAPPSASSGRLAPSPRTSLKGAVSNAIHNLCAIRRALDAPEPTRAVAPVNAVA